MFQRGSAEELRSLMRKDRRKLADPYALQDFAEHAKALAKSYKALKATPRWNGSRTAQITVRSLLTEKGSPSRSTVSSRRQGILVVEDQEDTSIAKALKEEDDSRILTQDDNDSNVLSIQTLTSRRHSRSKRHYEQSDVCKQQLRARF